MAISGIYAIVNKVNGHRYIGSSADITGRWKRHVSRLENNCHHSRHLQHAWDCYGKDSFDFIVIAECAVPELIAVEQKYIDEIAPEYNVSPVAGRTSGVIRTDEYKRKQSASQSGKVVSDESRKRISDGMKGKRNSLGTTRVVTEETRKAMSARMKGYCPSEETRRKLSEINRTYRHTDEAKRKIGEAARGNNHASHKHTPGEIEHQRVKMQEYWARRKATTSAESQH